MNFPLTEGDIRQIVHEEVVGERNRCGKREDCLIWAMRFYAETKAEPLNAADVVKAAKTFEAYVYGEESK